MRDCITPSTGSITLIGSGEMSPSMSRVHRMVMGKISGPVQAAFLDTPAGFQLNVDHISEKACQYFKKYFHLNLAVASFKSSNLPLARVEQTLSCLKTANYIFAGPGSPTYAVKNWQGSPVLQALYARLQSGANLVFASAAAIALGSYALPVYEIYKVGEAPFWMDGLNFFAPFGFAPTIIPHWNNMEGGTHDTRFCYMGKFRMEMLENKLPSAIVILGIEEHTAVTLDFNQRQCHVTGAGSVFLRNKNRELCFPPESAFDMGLLETFGNDPLSLEKTGPAEEKMDFSRQEPFAWPEESQKHGEIPLSFINWLVLFRSRLRNERKWDLADEIRERLDEFGILLDDGPTATSWRKKTD